MNKVLTCASFALALLVFPVSHASASLVKVGDIIRFQDGPGTGNGGEFKVDKLVGNWKNDLFRTFCVEIAEEIAFNTPYKIKSFNTVTVATGKQLSVAAARLFRAFWDMHMHGATNSFYGQTYRLDTSANRADDARSLQLAIWKAMGWDISGQSGSTAVKNKANAWLASATSAGNFTAGDSFGGVRIMNMVGPDGNGNFQDQLVVIPEPGSMLVWGLLGLAATVVSVRRRQG